MKRIIFSTLFIFLSIFIHAQTESPTEQFVLKLSEQKFQWMNANNLDKLKNVLDDRMIFIHSNGLTETKEELLANIPAGKWSLKKVEIKEAKARIYKNDVVIILGRGIFHAISQGTEVTPDLYYTEVWVKKKKGWLLTARHANKML